MNGGRNSDLNLNSSHWISQGGHKHFWFPVYMVCKDGGGIKTGGAEGLASILGLEPLRMKCFGQLFLFLSFFFLLFVSALVFQALAHTF